MNGFNIGQKLRGIIGNLKYVINNNLSNYNISEGQFEYFILIYENQGINQKDLANIMNVGKASVTKAMKKLLEEELVIRKINPEDNRHYGLFISEKGQPYVSLFNDMSTKINETMFANFTKDEVEMLEYLLTKMHNNSKTLKTKPLNT